jgi:hypothetical protein
MKVSDILLILFCLFILNCEQVTDDSSSITAPQNILIVPSSHKITIKWSPVKDANEYEIYLNSISNIPEIPYATTSNITITISGLSNGVIYYVWIRARNESSISPYSKILSSIPGISETDLYAPDSVLLVATSKQIIIKWSPVESATSYDIYFNTISLPPNTYYKNTTETSLTLTGLTNGTTYYFWIKSKNDSLISDFSEMVSAMPSYSNIPPSYPRDVQINSSDSCLSLTWSLVDSATSYDIYCSDTSIPPVQPLKTTTVNNCELTNLTNGVKYNIWIKAKNDIDSSNFSSMVSAIPIKNIFNVNINSSTGRILLSWPVVIGATSYEIYYTDSTIMPSSPQKVVTDINTTISGLTNGISYNIWLRAKNNYGSSDFYQVNNIIPLAIPILKESNLSENNISISWNTVSGAEFYEIYCGTGSIPELPLKTVNIANSIIENLSYGQTYYMWVKAKNSNGTSDPSNSLSCTLPPETIYITGNLNECLNYTSAAINNGSYVFTLTSSENIMPQTLFYSGLNVTIRIIANSEITLGTTSTGPSGNGLLTINSGVTLILDNNITISGNGSLSSIRIESGGTLIMNDGSKITSTNGHCVYVYSSASSFIMNGGKITGSNSSAVHNYGNFTMNGGRIFNNNNTTTSIGGGVENRGIFTMNGGIISGNTGGNGGGVWNYSTAIFFKDSSAIIYGNENNGYDEDGIILKNNATSGIGHAVFQYSTNKKRNTTAGMGVILDLSKNGAIGGWE